MEDKCIPVEEWEKKRKKMGMKEMDIIDRLDIFLKESTNKHTSVSAKNLKKGMEIWKFGTIDMISKQGHIVIAYSGKNKKKYDENESVTIIKESTNIHESIVDAEDGIMDVLGHKPMTKDELFNIVKKRSNVKRYEYNEALKSLVKDGDVKKDGNTYSLA